MSHNEELVQNPQLESPLMDPGKHQIQTFDIEEPKQRQMSVAEHTEHIRNFKQLRHVHKMTEQQKKNMMSYETLDFEIIQNEIMKEHELNETKLSRWYVSLINWFIFCLIGIMTGFSAFGIYELNEKLGGLRRDQAQNQIDKYLGTGKSTGVWHGFWVNLGFTYAFVLLANLICIFISPKAAGSGIPEVKSFLNGINQEGLLTWRTLFAKISGVIFAVSGGLFVGPEGPLIHTGSIWASCLSHVPGIGQKIPILKSYRNDHDKRNFVSGGAGAGISSAFGAPIGGMLFSFEEASSFWSVALMWRVLICTCFASFSVNFFRSASHNRIKEMDEPGLTGFGIVATGEYEPFQLWEFPFFILVGIVGGLVGATYNQIAFYLIKFRGKFQTKTIIRTIEVLITATLTCICFYTAPLFVGSCVDIPTQCQSQTTDKEDICGDILIRFNCPVGQYSQMATLTFTSLDNVAHSQFHGEADLGTGFPAGIFVPNIAIGSVFGRLIGNVAKDCQSYFNTPIFPGVYAVLGSAAMLAGTGRIAVALIAIFLETTGSVLYIIPLVIVIMTSKWVGDLLNISIYDITIELRPMPFVEPQPMLGYQQLEARDLMSYPVICFNQYETIERIMEKIFPKGEDRPHNGFPVINENNKLIGLILRNHLVVILRNYHQLFPDPHQDLSSGKLKIIDFATKMSSRLLGKKEEDLPNKDVLEQNKHKKINLGVYMNACPYTVYANSKLTKVFRLYRGMALRHVPVINLENEVVGIITRKELMTDFQQDLT